MGVTAYSMLFFSKSLQRLGRKKLARSFSLRASRIARRFGRDDDIKNDFSDAQPIQHLRHASADLSGQGRYCCYMMCGRRNEGESSMQKCSGCRVACYCSKACQKKAWRYHKNACK